MTADIEAKIAKARIAELIRWAAKAENAALKAEVEGRAADALIFREQATRYRAELVRLTGPVPVAAPEAEGEQAAQEAIERMTTPEVRAEVYREEIAALRDDSPDAPESPPLRLCALPVVAPVHRPPRRSGGRLRPADGARQAAL